MSEALALVETEAPKPTALMRQATDVANVCREIVMRTAMDLKGKKYVKVDGWSAIAATYGCIPSITSVVEDEKGITSIAELRKHDGTILATAQGFVGIDEPVWANRPGYARRGMSQTRAISRVCRTAFSFVVVLIDSNLSTTPAEEIPSDGEPLDAKPAPKVVQAVPAGGPLVRIGKSRGKLLSEIDDKDLSWQLKVAGENVEAEDPKWHKSNQEYLTQVQAEAARRVQG